MKILSIFRVAAILSIVCFCSLHADRVFGATIAISPQDFSNQVKLFDEAGVLQDTFSLLTGPVHDLGFDASTGDLYAFTGTAGTVAQLTSGGSSFTNLFNTGFVNFSSGADISANNGVIAISPQDFSNQVKLFDTAGVLQDTFSLLTGPVHDLEFDASTGDLYAFTGTAGTVAQLTSGGSSFTNLFNTGFVNFNSGADISVFSPAADPIPEPATIALLGIGLAGLAGAEVRRRRKKKTVDKS